MKKKYNKYICELCLPDVKELGEVIPGLWLGLDGKDGKLVLVGNDGHGGDVVHRFRKEPWIDPLEKRPGETDRQWSKRYDSAPRPLYRKNQDWIRMVEKELGWRVHLEDVVDMASRIKEGGWTRKDGSVALWMYARCARIARKGKGK